MGGNNIYIYIYIYIYIERERAYSWDRDREGREENNILVGRGGWSFDITVCIQNIDNQIEKDK